MTRIMSYVFVVVHVVYFLTDYLQIWWEHASGHHELHGLRACHVHAPLARVRMRSVIFGQIFSNLGGNILQVTTSCMDYVLSYSRTESMRTIVHVMSEHVITDFDGFFPKLVGPYCMSPRDACATQFVYPYTLSFP
jgi:hypothetical protein